MSHLLNSVSGPQHHFQRLTQNLRTVLLILLGLASFHFLDHSFIFPPSSFFSCMFSVPSFFLLESVTLTSVKP